MANRPHPLLAPRILSAIALGTFSALGIGLMLAAYIASGWALCLAAAIGTVWLYWADLKRFVVTRRRKRMSALKKKEVPIALAIIALDLALPPYLWVTKPDPAAVEATQGAGAYIEALGPERLNDGRYDFPVRVTNSGQSPVNRGTVVTAQKPELHVGSGTEENALMAALEASVLSRINKTPPDASQREDFGLAPHQSKIIRNPMEFIDEATYQAIKAGDKIFYTAVIYVYSDEYASSHNIVYYAEKCARFDIRFNSFVDCQGLGLHNFNRMIYRLDR